MIKLGTDAAPQILAKCQAGRDEIAQAFSRVFDLPIELSLATPVGFDSEKLSTALVGPGLAIVLTVGDAAALVLMNESGGLIPAWTGAPDATGKSKLSTLAQELGALLLPDDLSPDDSQTVRVVSLTDALRAAEVPPDGQSLALELASGSQPCSAIIVWPATRPQAVLAAAAAVQSSPIADKPSPSDSPKPSPATTAIQRAANDAAPRVRPSNRLPKYTRSLLHIEVPVIVTLAAKKQAIGQILELGPGSIIHFDNSCDEMLDLSVGGRRIAQGEAVKVGEKFGLRVTSIILPDERFKPVKVG